MSFVKTVPKVAFGGVDLSSFIKDSQIGLTPDEPKRVADNPHAPGTPEHRDWEIVNVHSPRQHSCDARKEAIRVADERIARVKAARSGMAAPRTFAYGKNVDDLMEFIESDRGPLLDDFVDGEALRTGGVFLPDGVFPSFGFKDIKIAWPSFSDLTVGSIA